MHAASLGNQLTSVGIDENSPRTSENAIPASYYPRATKKVRSCFLAESAGRGYGAQNRALAAFASETPPARPMPAFQ